jgi:hypothetical protein
MDISRRDYILIIRLNKVDHPHQFHLVSSNMLRVWVGQKSGERENFSVSSWTGTYTFPCSWTSEVLVCVISDLGFIISAFLVLSLQKAACGMSQPSRWWEPSSCTHISFWFCFSEDTWLIFSLKSTIHFTNCFAKSMRYFLEKRWSCFPFQIYFFLFCALLQWFGDTVKCWI